MKHEREIQASTVDRVRRTVISACLHRMSRVSIATAFRVWYLRTRDLKLNSRIRELHVFVRWYQAVCGVSKHRLVTRVLCRLESIILKSHIRVAFSRW